MKKVLLYLSLLLSSYSYALTIGPVKVEGVVVNYDNKFVTLQNGEEKIKVPKRTIPTEYKLRTGKKVHALLEVEDLNKIIRANYKKHMASRRLAKKRRIKSNRRLASERSINRDHDPEIEQSGLE